MLDTKSRLASVNTALESMVEKALQISLLYEYNMI